MIDGAFSKRRFAAALAVMVFLATAGGCARTYRHTLRAFQNGNELGAWTIRTDPSTVPYAVMDDGRRLVIIPADGVFIGTLWYRSGGLVIESEEVGS